MSHALRAGVIAAAGLLVASSVAEAARWRAIDRIPGHAAVTIRVEEKPRIYHRMTPEAPLSLDLEGPGRLRVVSRAILADLPGATVSYRLAVSEGAKVLQEHRTEASASATARIEGEGTALGKSRTTTVAIRSGRHHLTFSVSGSAVLARLLYSTPRRRERAMISLTPFEAARSVTVSEGERLIPYYTVMPSKPVRLKIVGPTPVEITCRLDFDQTMRGTQPYRLGIATDGRRVREVAFRTTKASTARYTDLRDRVASKLDRVVVALGDGAHELSVELLEPKRGSAEIHVRIPQPEVGTDE